MRLYVNERSLAEPHASTSAVACAINAFLRARSQHPLLRQAVYCAKLLPHLRLGDGKPLSAAVQSLPGPVRALFFTWVANQGPFLDDERQAIENDLFFFEGDEVTDEGLGEAGRQILLQRSAGAYSLLVDHGRFEATPLEVVRGFEDEPIDLIKIPNFWEPGSAETAIAADVPEPSRWPELLAIARARFTSLVIGMHCDEVLSRFPFEPNVARRAIELLGVLQCMVKETSADGVLSKAGLALREQHFVGDKAWFTDESDGNKRDFKHEMTFPDPAGGDQALTCFWHGKVKTPQYRIHFEWPIPAPFKKLRIAYIGPKIAKR